MATETAIFAAGCFWGVEAHFAALAGVTATEVGYSGGETRQPTYRQVCSGATGHAEVVRVEFDPEAIGYGELTRQGKLLISITFETFWTWGLVLLFYFSITYTLTNILKYAERKLKIPGLGLGGET